jgi:glycosyltransferase involved in cell wall biosynthesis
MSPISVVVPARDAESTIERTVQSLLEQEYPLGRFELIVVDNGSRDRTPRLLARYGSRIRVVRESRKGASAARNAGLRVASYPYIAFTDADCVPDSSWLRELMAYAARNPWANFIGGPIVAHQPRSRIERFSEWLWDQERALRAQPPYAITANLLVRRTLLFELGMFDEALLRGQDVDLSYRAHFRGARFGFADTAVVRHVNPRNLRQVFAKGLQHGHAVARLLEKYSRELGQTPWQRCLDGRRYASIGAHLAVLARSAWYRRPDLMSHSLFHAVFESGKQLGVWRDLVARGPARLALRHHEHGRVPGRAP